MPVDPFAVRVARRHLAAVVLRDVLPKTTRIELDCSGTVSATRLRFELEPQTGYLHRLRFRPSSDGPRGTITWEAVTGSGNPVTGTLALRAAVREGEVASWAEVTVDPT